MTAAFGSPRHHYAHTDSTNARARALAALGAPSGTVVTAAEQSAGRGRRGRAWSAPAGRALLYTAILRSLAERHALLPLAVPLAVADAIEALAPVECELKWPNDVWIERRKAAGILLESRPPEWALIGIGLNVSIDQDEFPSELRWPATSVGHGATVEGAVEALNDRLARWVGAEREEVLAAFRRRDGLVGRSLRWEGAADDAPEGAGTAAGIDDDGNLLVETADGRVSLGSGEVQLTPDGDS